MEILELDQVKLYAIVNCEDESSINAIQFILQDTVSEQLKYLQPIGRMSGDCQELKITSPIEKIIAYYSSFTEGGNLSSISYIKEGKMKTYGKWGGDFREWEFNEN